MTRLAPPAARRAALLAPLAALALTGSLQFATPDPAAASFPGRNGRILVVSNHVTPDNPEGDHEIYSMTAEGTGLRQVTRNAAADIDAVVSKDGTKIAFVSDRITPDNPEGDHEVFVMNADGSGIVQLTETGAGVDDRNPSWAPQTAGTGRLAYASDRDGDFEIWAMDADDGGNPLQLTKNTESDTDPAWAPKGNRIAFVSNRTGDLEVFAMGIAGTDQTNLTTDPGWDYAPAWSADGRRLAFATDRDGAFEVYTMSAVGGNPTNRSRNPAIDDEPVWSPDGDQIAFLRGNGAGITNAWVMRADGRGQKQRTDGEANTYATDWLTRGRETRSGTRAGADRQAQDQAEERRARGSNLEAVPEQGRGRDRAAFPAPDLAERSAGGSDGAARHHGKEGAANNR